jgi:signal transduction histidine kinase
MLAASAEALENVVRHAGTNQATVRLTSEPTVIAITDPGTGFDPASVPAHKLGLREAMVGQMMSVGGWTEVRSDPGVGACVLIGWP